MNDTASDLEHSLRVDLAAAFRLIARSNWHEAVANHLSVASAANGSQFLINRQWQHFARVRASELTLVEAQGSEDRAPDGIDPTAWAIHGTMHARLAHARCILHVHPPYATALSCLADPTLKPVDQTSARFFRRLSIDSVYGGMADNAAEGLRLTQALGDQRALIMRNHGVLVTGESVAEAFDAIYHLERAARTLMLAYASGQPFTVLSDEIAERTARSWEDGGAAARAHFEQMKYLLDAQDPSYAD